MLLVISLSTNVDLNCTGEPAARPSVTTDCGLMTYQFLILNLKF